MNRLRTDEIDKVWSKLQKEIKAMAESETMLASYLHATVLMKCLHAQRS